MTTNERLKFLRKERGLSMEAFGELIGMSKSNVSKLEKGEHNVADRNIKIICSEFRVNENWLRTGEGDMELTSNDQIAKVSWEAMLNGSEAQKSIFEELKNLDGVTEKDLEHILHFIKITKEARKNTTS